MFSIQIINKIKLIDILFLDWYYMSASKYCWHVVYTLLVKKKLIFLIDRNFNFIILWITWEMILLCYNNSSINAFVYTRCFLYSFFLVKSTTKIINCNLSINLVSKTSKRTIWCVFSNENSWNQTWSRFQNMITFSFIYFLVSCFEASRYLFNCSIWICKILIILNVIYHRIMHN